MPKKYATVEERREARRVSKRRYYTRHRAEEQEKARERWARAARHAKHDASRPKRKDGVNLMTEGASKEPSPQELLGELWVLHGGHNTSSELTLMRNRAQEVMRNVAERGWVNYRSICERSLATSRQLWTRAERFIAAVADTDACQESHGVLLAGGKRLLEACDRLVESEEEILELNDWSTETYVSAYEKRDLVWQKHSES